MYFDEEIVLDVRLNTLDQFVDYFVIVESKFTHKGDKRDLKFNPDKFEKFKDKIIYLVYNHQPSEIEKINNEDSPDEIARKSLWNAIYRENGQRNYIEKGLNEANENDIILISDVDEIPNLKNIEFKNISKKIILFKQNMFYYKFNLHLPNLIWTGTKGCRKKDLINPQWLRNIKDRKYSFFRLDTFFSKNKYRSVRRIIDGGWHFTNIKNAEAIEHKLKSYLHHGEFDLNPLSITQINEIIKKKHAIYDLSVDKTKSKIGSGNKLKKFELDRLPKYIQENKNNFKEWID
jgi:beta-1,4-mannosyl-glycoprotein beta-1,4-N-acetylglucosaminyltransferase|tara:strand:+ start:392 stop:1261 length:870 start_codon:yes stop_codon:yes gene_type:complete